MRRISGGCSDRTSRIISGRERICRSTRMRPNRDLSKRWRRGMSSSFTKSAASLTDTSGWLPDRVLANHKVPNRRGLSGKRCAHRAHASSERACRGVERALVDRQVVDGERFGELDDPLAEARALAPLALAEDATKAR